MVVEVPPVLLSVTCCLNLELLTVMVCAVRSSTQFTVTLVMVRADVDVFFTSPFCMVPAVALMVPVTVSCFPPRSSVPLVWLKLVTVALAASTGLLPAEVMTTWSIAAGTPLGVQLAAVVHAELEEPSHVRVVCATLCVEEKRKRKKEKSPTNGRTGKKVERLIRCFMAR